LIFVNTENPAPRLEIIFLCYARLNRLTWINA